MTQSQFVLGGSGESGGNESDNSTEESLTHRSETFKRPIGGVHHQKPKDEVALRKSHRDLSAHRSSISGNVFVDYCGILLKQFKAIYLNEQLKKI